MEETYKLSDLMGAIAETIEADFGGSYWITAELAAAHSKGKGYWVLELQESDEKGNKLAQTQAMVWANNVPRVIYKFQNATGQKLSAGMRVRLHVSGAFHPQWGFRLTVDNIDTEWTQGEAQANDENIRKKLKADGVWDLNRTLPRPQDFFNIAIVSPDTSAGLEDFLREADVLKNANLLNYDVYITPFEGPNALKGIPQAFQKVVAAHKPYDAVCVVRGGGAAAGIAWLNQDEIVRAVCKCPFPVLSGIGHERDQTLVDEVANVVCGTPSKTIGLVATLIIQNAQNAAQNWLAFQHEVDQRLLVAHQRLNEHFTSIEDITSNLIEHARRDTDNLMREAIGLGPLSTMERGYAVVQKKTGAVVKSVADVQPHDSISIRLADGVIQALIQPSSDQNAPKKFQDSVLQISNEKTKEKKRPRKKRPSQSQGDIL